MTPPPIRAWALFFGAGLAHVVVYGQGKIETSAIRVALFSMWGGGIGFSFVILFQVWKYHGKIPFKHVNVMEYSIGVFRWIGMGLWGKL